MNNKKDLFLIISTVIIISLSLTPSLRSLVNIANAQSPICDNKISSPSPPYNGLPVILIHGYREDSSVWYQWENYLSDDKVPFCAISFQPSSNGPYDQNNYDACGSAAHHAKDLAQIVQYVKQVTGQDKVNIVGHSKGGLDARVYLADTNTPDIANLIMIGTPNAGGLWADSNVFNPFDKCIPAKKDLTSYANDIKAIQNNHTQYYDIAGVCSFLPKPNDGFVTVESAQSLLYSKHLPPTEDCHLFLLGKSEYQLVVKSILLTK